MASLRRVTGLLPRMVYRVTRRTYLETAPENDTCSPCGMVRDAQKLAQQSHLPFSSRLFASPVFWYFHFVLVYLYTSNSSALFSMTGGFASEAFVVGPDQLFHVFRLRWVCLRGVIRPRANRFTSFVVGPDQPFHVFRLRWLCSRGVIRSRPAVSLFRIYVFHVSPPTFFVLFPV